MCLATFPRLRHISTHSLTRRLTRSDEVFATVAKNFNSQPHKEADAIATLGNIPSQVFQLTASQGG